MTKPITLTDPPEIVELKREFRKLDAREQELKAPVPGAQSFSCFSPELDAVRRRKAEIAKAIFADPPARTMDFSQTLRQA